MTYSIPRQLKLACAAALAAAPVGWFAVPTATAPAGPVASALAGPLCHAPSAFTARGTFVQLAAVATEVPPAEIQAIMPAPAFADRHPPLWEGLATVTSQITTPLP